MSFFNFFKALSLLLQNGLDVIFRDPLTDVYNRRFFKEISLNIFERSRRYKRPLSVIIFDIDNFKKINDTLGHLEGDKVLKKVAEILVNNSRKADLIFRWGGDEFLMLLPETNEEEANKFIERIIENFINEKIEISYGLASWNEKYSSFEELIQEADNRLYQFKNKKKIKY